MNTSHIGIQFMVGDGDPFPSPAMVARAVRLRADVKGLCPNIGRDWGHRDDPKTSTECPGDAIYKWVHSGGPTQHTSTPTISEDDMTPEQDARLTRIETQIDALIAAEAGRYSTATGRQRYLETLIAADNVDVTELATALAAALPAPTDGGPVTDAQLEGALRKVLGSVDDTPAATA